jgi:hypothetical protein
MRPESRHDTPLDAIEKRLDRMEKGKPQGEEKQQLTDDPHTDSISCCPGR